MVLTDTHITLYRSLFRGREDAYARWWSRGDKSGYTPVYTTGADDNTLGGSITVQSGDQRKGNPAPLTWQVIRSHLSGKQMIAIYPLLKNNSSWFIAVDLDGESWMDEGRLLVKACEQYDLFACLERSRSGKAGHLWVFFEEPWPAWKSRKVMMRLLLECGIPPDYDPPTGFDRLFPGQDFVHTTDPGSLIAPPLNRACMEQGNTCFLDPQTMEPWPDQWDFLARIRRNPISRLDSLFAQLQPDHVDSTTRSEKTIRIILDNQVWLEKPEADAGIEPETEPQPETSPVQEIDPKARMEAASEIDSELDTQPETEPVQTSEKAENEELGLLSYVKEKLATLHAKQQTEEFEGESARRILLPRGFLPELTGYARMTGHAIRMDDRRKKRPPVSFQSSITLYPFQEKGLEETAQFDFGVLVAPPGSGKTMMGLELIARKQQPALILVHRKQLFDQWTERITTFLGISKNRIGRISKDQKKPGREVTVAMIQSLHRAAKEHRSDLFPGEYGTIIVDECHHIPAKTFREVITQLQTYYLYGLTATPFRKSNDENLAYAYIGNVLSEIPSDFAGQKKSGNLQILVHETDFRVPFDTGKAQADLLMRILVHDTARNRLIAGDVREMVDRKQTVLLLTGSVDHIEILHHYLRDRFETITLSEQDSMRSRRSKLAQFRTGHFQAAITTPDFIDESIDPGRFDGLFLTSPMPVSANLTSFIRAAGKTGNPPVIHDYRDRHIGIYEKLFQKRNRFYNKIRKGAQVSLGF